MRFFLCFTLLFSSASVFAESISEKKQLLNCQSTDPSSKELKKVHQEMVEIRASLKALYLKSEALIEQDEKEEELKKILADSKKLKSKLSEKERQFRSLNTSNQEDEYFSLMHESEVTLEQLIIDYASSNYLYVIPAEMAKIQLNLCSSLPIPKASWEEVVELICSQNGIGIKPLNSFVKSLYWNLGNNTASLKYIAHKPEELDLIDPFQRVCYVLSLEHSETQRIHHFLKRFVNERLTSLHTVGSNLVMVGEAGEIKELTKLIGFVKKHQKEKTYKLIPIEKVPSDDWQNILTACFTDPSLESNKEVNCPILMYPMQKYLLLLGSKQDLEKAENIIHEINDQVTNPEQMTIYWYTCKYSEPGELASLLQQVYQMMVHQIDDEEIESAVQSFSVAKATPCVNRGGKMPPICDTAPQLVVNPARAQPPQNPLEPKTQRPLPNFIVDSKSGMIIMVVKQSYLEKLRELAKKLDIAKKMVQIEVLLFEKKINDQTQFGLNLFNLGDKSNNADAGFIWTVDKSKRSSPGILDYFFGRKKKPGTFPAFNFAYNFLISQDDIYVHSNPTVTTVNQTPAVIDLIEEQSVNMGTVEDTLTSTISNTYIRAQYGTFIQITPTVNMGDEEDDFQHFITLDTNITFDTTTSSVDDRPNVNRRHIQNQVRIPNGETLILGGLRRKKSEDHVDKIPFLGDIPGLGKFFSFTSLSDRSTEMFIFITPRVVEDSFSDFEKYQKIDLKKRPGDSPELLKKLLESKSIEKENAYRMSLKQLFKHV